MANKKVYVHIDYKCNTNQLQKATELLERFQKAVNGLKKTGITLNVHVNRKGNVKKGRQTKKV
jgi:hypothetical protein